MIAKPCFFVHCMQDEISLDIPDKLKSNNLAYIDTFYGIKKGFNPIHPGLLILTFTLR